jgi:type I restriction enzyme S subunit
VLKTSSVYGGVFDPTENKEVDSYDLDRVSCPVLAGSLIVSRMNTKRHLGAAAAVRQDFPNLYLPDRLWAVTFCGAEPRFIDWWTKTPAYRSEVEAVCVGTSSSMQNISQGDFLGLRIELPDVETQRAIADYLDRETARIDTLIEEQQRLIDLLRERRYAVVDRAIRRGVVNARMTDSGDPLVGEVPEGWSVVHIRRVATSLDSRRIPLSSEQRAERTGPFPYYGATSVIDHIDDYIFDEPLVLVAEDGFGLLYRSKPIAVHVEGRIWVNNHAHALRPLGVPAHLLAARIESENLVPYLAGSRQPKLTAEALMGMRISIPPEDQWSQILAVLDEETAKIDTLIAETERFVELARERRSALITAAVTGQIDMREMA